MSTTANLEGVALLYIIRVSAITKKKAAEEFSRQHVEHHPYLKDMMNDPRWQPALQQFESAYPTFDQ